MSVWTPYVEADANVLVSTNSVSWTNATNAYTDDTSYAQVTGSSVLSDSRRWYSSEPYLTDLLGDLKFGDTLDGIECRFKLYDNGGLMYHRFYGGSASYDSTYQSFNATTTPAYYTRGGAADLLGTNLTTTILLNQRSSNQVGNQFYGDLGVSDTCRLYYTTWRASYTPETFSDGWEYVGIQYKSGTVNNTGTYFTVVFNTATVNRIEAGDVAIFHAQVNSSVNGSWSGAFGSTAISTWTANSDKNILAYKVLTAQAGAVSVYFGGSSGQGATGYGTVIILRGVDPNDVVDAQNTGVLTSGVAETVTTTGPNKLMVCGTYLGPSYTNMLSGYTYRGWAWTGGNWATKFEATAGLKSPGQWGTDTSAATAWTLALNLIPQTGVASIDTAAFSTIDTFDETTPSAADTLNGVVF
jgi:hypothetical protein